MSGSRAAGFAALSMLAAVLVLPTAAPRAAADAGTLYVDSKNAACSDAGAGTQEQPYCGIQAAADAARPGDTVRVAPGPTTPALDLTGSGAPGEPITFDGEGRISLDSLTIDGAHDVVMHDFSVRLPAHGTVQVRDSGDVTLDGGQFEASEGAPAVEVSGASSDVTISRSLVLGDSGPGIVIGPGVRHTVVTTDDISGWGNDDAVRVDGTIGTVVTSNTLWDVRAGLSVTGGATGTVAENNQVYCTDVRVDADSAVTTTAAYNLFSPCAGGDAYQWAGVVYTDLPVFQAATGQGTRDIQTGTVSLESPGPGLAEGLAGIDAADADAPGELPTDLHGRPHVDDPLVADTGTGAGYIDRGAYEFQDPYRAQGITATPDATEAGHPVTVGVRSSNPWGTAVSRTFDFGDGTPVVTTTADSVQHVYAAPASGASTAYRVTVQDSGHSFQQTVQVNPDGPLVARIGSSGQDPGNPLAVTFADTSTSPFARTSCSIAFGDGATAQQAFTCEGVTHTYAKPGSYTVTMTETDAGGRSAHVSTKVTVGPVFVALDPTRVLDTRTGLGAPKAHVGAGRTVRFKVDGAAGIAHATSALLNVTVTNTTGGGVVTAYPGGAARPTASVLNYAKGQTVANLVTVPVGSDGTVTLYNSAGSVDLVADVEGYSTLNPGAGGGDILMKDNRLGEFWQVLDTSGRSGLPKLGKVGAGKSVTFSALDYIANPGWTQYGATAVVLQVTATGGTAHSYVTAHRPDQAVPNSSNLNFAAGETRSAMVVVPVDAQGRVTLTNHAGSVDLSASVEGFYLPFSTSIDPHNKPMTAITPRRVLDTRSGLGARKGPIPATGRIHFKAAGVAGVPAGATGVLLNLTAVGATANGSLRIWDDGDYEAPEPALTFMRGRTTPVLVYVPLTNGSVDLYSPSGSVHAVADVEAYSMN